MQLLLLHCLLTFGSISQKPWINFELIWSELVLRGQRAGRPWGRRRDPIRPHLRGGQGALQRDLLPGRTVGEARWIPLGSPNLFCLFLFPTACLPQIQSVEAAVNPCLGTFWKTCMQGQFAWPNALLPAACNMSNNLCQAEHAAYVWCKRGGWRAGCHCRRLLSWSRIWKAAVWLIPEIFFNSFWKHSL